MNILEAINVLNTNVIYACEKAGWGSSTIALVTDALDTINEAVAKERSVSMEHRTFANDLQEWTDKVIEAQRQFDEEDRDNPNVWYRPELMVEAVKEILDKGFER